LVLYQIRVVDANGCTVVKMMFVASDPDDLILISLLANTIALGGTAVAVSITC
jgi:hypothetical protein